MTAPLRHPAWLLACLVAGLAAGCDETLVSPFVPNDAHFSVYGYLDTGAAEHELRVVPLRRRLERPTAPPPPPDFQVVTVEVETGRENRWTLVEPLLPDGRRGVRFADSTFGYVFRDAFPAFPGRTYRLEIRGFDGRTTRAEAAAPPQPTSTHEPAYVAADSVSQVVHWERVVRSPDRVEMLYVVVSGLLPGGKDGFYVEQPDAEVDEAGRVRVVVDLARDLYEIRRRIAARTFDEGGAGPHDVSIGIERARLRLFVLDDVWAARQALPPGQQAQPGSTTNVENGFGFFGVRGLFVHDWEIPFDVQSAALAAR